MALRHAMKTLKDTLHVRTPLVHSVTLSKHLGVPVWLKMETMQPSGSFKLRGISLTVQRALERGVTSIVSSSGGNAGLAVAYACHLLKSPCTVCVPETTPEFIRDRLRAYDADVVIHGAMWADANRRATELAKERNGLLVHPFEGQDTWEGHGSMVVELEEDMQAPPGAIVASVGGGGLMMGVLEGLRRVGWAGSVKCLAVETQGADAFAQALAADGLVTLPAITSIAKSLGADRVSETLFERGQALQSRGLMESWVCSDAAAVDACLRFADDHRILVEPACGAALAAVYERHPALVARGAEGAGIVVIVCGGGIVDRASLRAQEQQFCPGGLKSPSEP